jgi:hypothetical protein
MDLDKDILHKGNKIYSSDTCVFVPQFINKLFINRNADRGILPLGVKTCGKKYYVQCSSGNRVIKNLGTYSTQIEAFNVYKKYKENLIKEVANEYKDKIPNRLYTAMVNYEVEITD